MNLEPEPIRPDTNGNGSLPPRERATVTIAHHLRDLSGEALTLVRGEIALAKKELDEKIEVTKRGLVASLAGGAALAGGLVVLLGALVIGLDRMLPLWLSALLVGVVAMLVGAALVLKGKRSLTAQELRPHRVIAEGRKTRALIKEETT